MIDTLPEDSLLVLAQFVEFLQFQREHSQKTTRLEIQPSPQLLKLVECIQQTPPDPNRIIWPTKSWSDYSAQLDVQPETTLDVETWNRQWDELEAKMEAESLAHEAYERQQES
jgi:hypothetical protein